MANTPKNILQLVNQAGAAALDIKLGDSSDTQFNFCDWDIDGHGHLRLITQQNAMVQTVLKNIFTEKQPSGYGTNLYALIGEKDVMARRVTLTIDITLAILSQKGFLDAQAVAQDLSPDDLISVISSLTITEDDGNPSLSRVSMTIQANSGQKTPVGVL